MELVTVDDVRTAAKRIDGLVVRTPLLECEQLSTELGCRVLIKAESLQHTGSFKPRGVLNTMLSWQERGELPEGVVGFSAGNHAAALAYAGNRLGVRAVVSMPTDANPSKVDNVRRYGGQIVPSDDLMGTCAELGERYGWLALYPFDMPEVIAGQGTVGLEICADEPEPDLVLVPVGGGGLIAGIATAVKASSPSTVVIGVEPSESNALGQAMRAGEVVRLPAGQRTVADGLAAPFAGVHTLAQARVRRPAVRGVRARHRGVLVPDGAGQQARTGTVGGGRARRAALRCRRGAQGWRSRAGGLRRKHRRGVPAAAQRIRLTCTGWSP